MVRLGKRVIDSEKPAVEVLGKRSDVDPIPIVARRNEAVFPSAARERADRGLVDVEMKYVAAPLCVSAPGEAVGMEMAVVLGDAVVAAGGLPAVV